MEVVTDASDLQLIEEIEELRKFMRETRQSIDCSNERMNECFARIMRDNVEMDRDLEKLNRMIASNHKKRIEGIKQLNAYFCERMEQVVDSVALKIETNSNELSKDIRALGDAILSSVENKLDNIRPTRPVPAEFNVTCQEDILKMTSVRCTELLRFYGLRVGGRVAEKRQRLIDHLTD